MKKALTAVAARSAGLFPLPRPHLYAIMMLALFSLVSLLLLPPPDALLSNKPLSIATADRTDDAELSKLAVDTEFIGEPVDLLSSDDVAMASDDDRAALDYTVKDDDNLSSIFNTLNISAATLQQLISVDAEHSLEALKPGQRLSFYLDDQHELTKLSMPLQADKAIIFQRKAGSYRRYIDTHDAALSTPNNRSVNERVSATEQEQKAFVRPSRLLKATINGSFALSARNAGFSTAHVRQITRLFQGRVDFRHDLSKGDSVRVLFDRPLSDGHATDKAKVLAVLLRTKDKTYSAYRSVDDNQFYDETGNSLSLSQSGKFMRYPISGLTKTSSGFNPTRRNPVTGIVMPHNGTDFPVHVGTPVAVTGDGVVVKTAIHPACGIYVVVRHSARYSSVYMHLSKALVKSGQKLKMGQVIALSGNTGRTTGPHLHYEFHVDNHPVDAMRVDLPINDAVPTKAKRSLLAKIKAYQHQLMQS
nr:peptidoglycan DD-metalloendopeptidase family protein [uncultured Tolumonas sp.]